jgi:hypothetical protein
MRRLLPLLVVLAGLLLAGSALAASKSWRHLASVTVRVQRTSPAPPTPGARTRQFTSPSQLAMVTQALNANHIALGSHPNHQGVCIGGTNIQIKIVPAHGPRVTLNGYHCGTQTFGTISGRVVPFLKAIGLAI